MNRKKLTLGFIGQGYVGKSYADDFEARGYTVIRYSKEKPYQANKAKITEADIVFVAVPTPTVAGKFDDSILRSVLSLVGEGKVAVIKSTSLPGTTNKLADSFPDIFIVHSPEFLSEKTALEDARMPRRNIIGIPEGTAEYRAIAGEILALLPSAPYELVCMAREAEIIKYANNAFFYTKIVFMNTLFDFAQANGCSWDVIRDAMMHEPWIGTMHLDPIHKSGRGAGGACFIKDFAAYRGAYEHQCSDDVAGIAALRALESKNLELLASSEKDQHLVRGVYGGE
jgi:nucleotide sugar dehydrogenase